MNERIRELAEQAGLKWEAQPPHYTNTDNPIDFPVSANRELERFAESIIRECADIASDVGTDTVPTDFALDKCYEIEAKILENFRLKKST